MSETILTQNNPKDALEAHGTIAVYSAASERFVQDLHAVCGSPVGVDEDEYLSFSFWVKNSSQTIYKGKRAYVRINGGPEMGWGSFKLNAGADTLFHVYHTNMKKLAYGSYNVDFYADGELIKSERFTILRDWSTCLNLPSPSEIAHFHSANRSQYISFHPRFPDSKGYTKYHVDVKADYLPVGTYLCGCNWGMDFTELKSRYVSIDRKTTDVAAYAGFQVTNDGRHQVIFSVWDFLCEDSSGKKITLRAKQVYPETSEDKTFGNEGTGVHCKVPYDWKAGVFYRMILEQSTSKETGHCVITMSVCDMDTNITTKLAAFDMVLTNTFMTWSCAFLENFNAARSGDVRTMELSNIYVFDRIKEIWIPADGGTFYARKSGFVGSYNYGCDGKQFWAITTGLPDRCEAPESGKQFTLRHEMGRS